MTTYKHIVQVHPVENGEVNFGKVELAQEFDTKIECMKIIEGFNKMQLAHAVFSVEE